MKTNHVYSIAVCWLLALSMIQLQAEGEAYEQILKEREEILSQLVEVRQVQFANGRADEWAVLEAQVGLWSFRRDIAKSTAGKIQQQELVLGAYEKRLMSLKRQFKQGEASQVDVLQATDALLRAKQLLLEL